MPSGHPQTRAIHGEPEGLRGEGRGEGQTLAPTFLAAPHPNRLPMPEEAWGEGICAVRLGLRLIAGLPEELTKETILKARGSGYADIPSLWMRSGGPVSILERLADADAFRSMRLDRRA